jgi:type III restriction enzyme
LGTRAEVAVANYPRNPAMSKVFEHLKALPTYSVSRVPKMTNVKRALRLAGLLTIEGLNENADDEVRGVFVKKLRELRDKYAKTVPEWGDVIREGGEIELDITLVATSGMTVTGTKSQHLLLTEENIEQLFDATGRLLAAGEGLHRTYWKRYHDKEKPNEAKLELFALMRQPDVLPTLAKLAKEEFDAWWSKHKADIRKLPASIRARFNALFQTSGVPAVQDWELPDQIIEKKEGSVWKKHLFCDADGGFSAKLNGWETELLKDKMEEVDFVCWLRNTPQKEWALCVPYEINGVARSFFPDFAVVRKTGKDFVVDILEPHNDSYVDALPKAIGLAKFAAEHGEEFGHIIIARKVGNNWQYADMSDKATREKTLKMQPGSYIGGLFNQ